MKKKFGEFKKIILCLSCANKMKKGGVIVHIGECLDHWDDNTMCEWCGDTEQEVYYCFIDERD